MRQISKLKIEYVRVVNVDAEAYLNGLSFLVVYHTLYADAVTKPHSARCWIFVNEKLKLNADAEAL